MRNMTEITTALQALLSNLPAAQDRPFVIHAGELRAVMESCKAKVEALPKGDPLHEVFAAYHQAATNHGATIQFTVSARRLQSVMSVTEAPKPAPQSSSQKAAS